jgi:hypothetical protein
MGDGAGPVVSRDRLRDKPGSSLVREKDKRIHCRREYNCLDDSACGDAEYSKDGLQTKCQCREHRLAQDRRLTQYVLSTETKFNVKCRQRILW